RNEMRTAQSHINPELRWETLVEFGDIEVWYGDIEKATDVLTELQALREEAPWALAQIDATAAHFAIRSGDLARANLLLQGISTNEPCSSTAHKARILATRAHLRIAARDAQAPLSLSEALEQARNQGAGFW